MASFHHHIASGLPGTALDHARYVLRIGRYNMRGDLIYSEYANMPWWAQTDSLSFWKAADENERVNGAAYREQVIALPNELTHHQQIELARQLARTLVGIKPYVLAIHSPSAAIGGIPNTHLHLMYSDRMPDDIGRVPGAEFFRFNRDNPERGGWQKDSGGKTRMETRDQVIAWRRSCADIQNEALEANGHTTRVDHRSLEQQGIDRPPEWHLGAWRVRNMPQEAIVEYADKWRAAPAT